MALGNFIYRKQNFIKKGDLEADLLKMSELSKL